MKTSIKLLTLALAVAGAAQTLFAQTAVPNIITYQGRVNVGGQPFTGTGQFKFALVSGGTNTARQAFAGAPYPMGVFNGVILGDGGAGYTTAPTVTYSSYPGGSGGIATATVSGGAVTSITVNNVGTGYFGYIAFIIDPPPVTLGYTTYWSHDGTGANGGQPTSAVTLTVANGLFVVGLGDTNAANMTALPANVATNESVRLRLWFNDGTNGFAQLTPDQPLTAAPYALLAQRAAQLEGTSTGPVTLNNVANSFSGNGAGLNSVNATTLGGLAVSNFWKIGGNAGTTAGANFIGTTDNRALEFKVNAARALRLEYASNNIDGISPNVIGGSSGNVVSNGVVGALIGGGGYVTHENIVGGDYASVVGGVANYAIGAYSAVLGGAANKATGHSATAMGIGNAANGNYSTAMGNSTTADGIASLAAGQNANATVAADNAFVWGDGSAATTGSTYRSVTFRASGGYRFFTGSGTGGAQLAAGATAWAVISDRNVKKDFAAVDALDILEKLSAMPVTQWHYNWETADTTPHIGPMAQDFKHAFYPGSDDKSITTLEADGVAFAAIQGLNEKVESGKRKAEKAETQMAELQNENAELKARLEKLEQLLNLK